MENKLKSCMMVLSRVLKIRNTYLLGLVRSAETQLKFFKIQVAVVPVLEEFVNLDFSSTTD